MKNDRLVALRVAQAASTASRLRGLLGTLEPPRHGLWMPGCRAVHTFGMRYPIDVVFVSAAHRVLAIRARLAPWRIALCRRARGVIELAAGAAATHGLVPGTALSLEIASASVGARPTPAAADREAP